MSIITRFPPEPNGHIHIGHLKAMIIDFNKHENCNCILRFDDTNPETEKQEYADSIMEDIKWLGFEWQKITYTSDYFEEFISIGERLIKEGKAYMDFSTSKEIEYQKGKRINSKGKVWWDKPLESPYRERFSIETNSDLFELMKLGMFKESACTLRLKMDPFSVNPNLRDPIAFRIKYVPHYRTGEKYCVYPSYDFSHCLTDSIENITMSYCTLEFESRNAQYHAIIDLVGNDMHHPTIYEFSRLKLEGSITSKRNIKSLIEDGHLGGYDDPGLLTIKGLKRRGFTPKTLIDAVSGLGHTRSITTLTIPYLESFIRKELNETSQRMFSVLDPISVEIVNVSDDFCLDVDKKVYPQNESSTDTRRISLTKHFYIDDSDFKSVAPKKYFRLTPTNPVRLKYGKCIIEYVSHEENESGTVTSLKVKYISDTTTKVKGCISWLSKNNAIPSIFKNFSSLLTDKGEFNPNSIQIHKGYSEDIDLKQGDRIQIERFGYYILDSISANPLSLETRENTRIFNCITSLKEDKSK
jgi:glutaminyl-tRNA synthetase